MKILLIAEKPDLKNKIKSAYDNHKNEFHEYDIDFLNQVGHSLTLLDPSDLKQISGVSHFDLPIAPEDICGWKYKVIPGKEKIYNQIKEAVKSGKYDAIIHAGDSDQEGQLLVDIVLEKLHAKKYVKKIYRFWVNAETEDEFVKALKNLRDNDEEFFRNLHDAGLLRQHSDWRFGMNGSKAVKRKTGSRAAVGRVKTAALKIVVDREQEIKNFVPKTTYGVKALYQHPENNFEGTYFIPNNKEKKEVDETAEDDVSGVVYFDKEDDAKKLIAGFDTFEANVVSVDKKRITEYAPAPYSLGTLQSAASAMYGYTPSDTLSYVQSLYEQGIMTYPRTDCSLLDSSLDFKGLISVVCKINEFKNWGEQITDEDISRVKNTKKYVNAEEMAKHGHSALSPTLKPANLAILTQEELNIYKLVLKKWLAIFLPPLVIERTKIITKIYNSNLEDYCYFFSSGKQLISKGYTEFAGISTQNTYIPKNIIEGNSLHIEEFVIHTKTTVCPKRFTEGTLADAMRSPAKYLSNHSLKLQKGIGTASTTGAIIKRLIEKDMYISREKKGKIVYLKPTESGKFLIDMLKDFDICKIDMSAEWEDLLSKIRFGEIDFESGEQIMKDAVEKLVADIDSLDISNITAPAVMLPSNPRKACDCPCGGEIIEAEKNFFCSRYKEGCKNSMFKTFMGAKFTKNDVKKLIEKQESVKKTVTKTDGSASWEQVLIYDFDNHKVTFKPKTSKK